MKGLETFKSFELTKVASVPSQKFSNATLDNNFYIAFLLLVIFLKLRKSYRIPKTMPTIMTTCTTTQARSVSPSSSHMSRSDTFPGKFYYLH